MIAQPPPCGYLSQANEAVLNKYLMTYNAEI